MPRAPVTNLLQCCNFLVGHIPWNMPREYTRV
jgi:hypothetical protein